MLKPATAERLTFFSDGVFAVIITILALDLRPPHGHAWSDFLHLWPTAVSYAASYLFVAIVWVNHHHLMRFTEDASTRLIWSNFAHLFSVSLVPFSTSWMAESRMESVPVSVYAAVFVLVNLTYIALCFEAIFKHATEKISPRARRMMRIRSLISLGVFAAAAIIANWVPLLGFGLIFACLIVYTRPDAFDAAA
ncbi:MAG TPA: TMEM175 family protein [Burkholderiales bacterium]